MLGTETVNLEAERERLREQLEEKVDRQIELRDRLHADDVELTDKQEESTRERIATLSEQSTDLSDRIAVLGEAIEEWDVDSVTFKGLSTGDIERVKNTVEEYETVASRDAWVAIGTVEAPYVKHNPSDIKQPAYEETVREVTKTIPLPLAEWAEAKISELSHLGAEEGNEYLALLREKSNQSWDQVPTQTVSGDESG